MTALLRSSAWTVPGGRLWPSLVAEDLRRVRDPLFSWLRPPAPVPAPAVASALAHALLPPVAPDTPPPWLRSDQRLSFGRALAAARRHGGALLADGVGSGKTWIGLAVAAALEPGRPAHVIAPATLRSQWEAVAARTGIPIRFHSHETLSRGRSPPAVSAPVIVDESHRFRNPGTRRYDVLCRWCAGRRGVLLSASPAVNRVEDVEHQLLLLVRHDQLTSGIQGLVVTGEDRTSGLPDRIALVVRPEEPPDSPAGAVLDGLLRLRLSRDGGIAALIRVALLEAMASSPAALTAALQRYRALLEHGGDAARSGITVSRRRIRQLVGADLDQLVLWPLVAEPGPSTELDLADHPSVVRLIGLAGAWMRAGDAKLEALRHLTSDRRPTLVFTTSLATARHLRRGIGRNGVAWCTGNGAGLDHQSVERELVLDWFRRGGGPEASLLVATDVAAEGLDLPRIERVVHYDLPWTAVRLEQRAGRALRLLSGQRSVEVIRFRPPRPLERQLDKLAVIRTKDALVDRLGLRDEPEAPWRRSARLAARWSAVAPREGIACVTGRERSIVAGVRIRAGDGTTRCLVRARLGGSWTGEGREITRLLESGAASPAATIDSSKVRSALTAIAAMLRPELQALAGVPLSGAPLEPATRALIRRLRTLARHAMGTRRRELLPAIDRGIRVLRGGHTAGERRLMAAWAGLADRELLKAVAALQEQPQSPSDSIEIIGILLVEPVPGQR